MSEIAGIELPVNSRFSISANPNVAPGFCAVCRNPGGDGRWFVDFGFNLDWYGAVYFCSECVRELATGIGYGPKNEVDALKELVNKLTRELGTIVRNYEEYRVAAKRVLRNCNCELPHSQLEPAESPPGNEPGASKGKSRPEGDDSLAE